MSAVPAVECKDVVDGVADEAELRRVLEDYASFKYCKTNIVAEVRNRFESKMDKFIFDSLPLTNSQKEELLLSVFATRED
jgi:hypothetical protein